MLVLKIMMRQRLKRSARKICTAVSRTLHDDRGTNTVHSCAVVNCFDKRTKLLARPNSRGDQNCLPSNFQHHRCYSTDPPKDFPLLTDLPMRQDATPFSGIKFMLMDIFVIRPQLDRDFSLKTFVRTTEKAS